MIIEKNIPIPEGRLQPGSIKSVLMAMQVGDSVVIETLRVTSFRVQAHKLKDRKFTVRQQADHYRAWRTA